MSTETPSSTASTRTQEEDLAAAVHLPVAAPIRDATTKGDWDEAIPEFDFSSSRVVYNNLGGKGPLLDEPEELRYGEVCFSRSRPVDAEFVAVSRYTPRSASLNGLRGNYANINLASGSFVNLLLQFVWSQSETPVSLSRVYLKILDGDMGGKDLAWTREIVVHGYDKHVAPAAYWFSHVSKIFITLRAVNDEPNFLGRQGRNFLLALHAGENCASGQGSMLVPSTSRVSSMAKVVMPVPSAAWASPPRSIRTRAAMAEEQAMTLEEADVLIPTTSTRALMTEVDDAHLFTELRAVAAAAKTAQDLGISGGTTGPNVPLTFTVLGVDYALLMERPMLVSAFEAGIRTAIAIEAQNGIKSDAVALTLSPGSIIVWAVVYLSRRGVIFSVQSALGYSSTLADTLQSEVSSIKGIAAVSTGSILITDISVPPFSTKTTTQVTTATSTTATATTLSSGTTTTRSATATSTATKSTSRTTSRGSSTTAATTSSTPTTTTETTTAWPQTPSASVPLLLKIENLDYGALAEDPPVLRQFRTNLQKAIALEAGFGTRARDVALMLSALGPDLIFVQAVVRADDVILPLVRTRLSSSTSLGETILAWINQVAGLGEATSGTVRVSDISVVRLSPQASALGSANASVAGRTWSLDGVGLPAPFLPTTTTATALPTVTTTFTTTSTTSVATTATATTASSTTSTTRSTITSVTTVSSTTTSLTQTTTTRTTATHTTTTTTATSTRTTTTSTQTDLVQFIPMDGELTMDDVAALTWVGRPPGVPVALTVDSVDHAALLAQEQLLSAFNATLKQAVATAAGISVQPSDVFLALSPGSVHVQALVAPKGGAGLQALRARLLIANDTLGMAIASALANIIGLSNVGTGQINVRDVSIGSVLVPRAAPAPSSSRASSSWRIFLAPVVLLAMCCGVPMLGFFLRRCGFKPGGHRTGSLQGRAGWYKPVTGTDSAGRPLYSTSEKVRRQPSYVSEAYGQPSLEALARNPPPQHDVRWVEREVSQESEQPPPPPAPTRSRPLSGETDYLERVASTTADAWSTRNYDPARREAQLIDLGDEAPSRSDPNLRHEKTWLAPSQGFQPLHTWPTRGPIVVEGAILRPPRESSTPKAAVSRSPSPAHRVARQERQPVAVVEGAPMRVVKEVVQPQNGSFHSAGRLRVAAPPPSTAHAAVLPVPQAAATAAPRLAAQHTYPALPLRAVPTAAVVPGAVVPSQALPTATVGLDLNLNGRADVVLTGTDLNHDGIPDILQQAPGVMFLGQAPASTGSSTADVVSRMLRM